MEKHADLVVRNASVFTAAGSSDVRLRGFAVADGRIVAVAADAPEVLDPYCGEGTQVVDLGGAMVVPGIFDAHTHHLIGGATQLSQLRFPVTATLDEILGAVDAWSTTLPSGAWVTGGSWGSTLLGEISTVAARHRLDAVSHGHPVVLYDDSHHNNWVNTEALRLAGIDTSVGVENADGTILDPSTGEVAGVLLERAVLPVRQARDAAERMTDEDWRGFSEKALQMYAEMGVTGLQEAVAEGRELRALRTMEREGLLHARVVCCLLFIGSLNPGAETPEELDALARDVASDLLRTDWVKLHLDGVPPAQTAAFLEPYAPSAEHGHDHRGAVYIEHERLVELLKEYADAGRSVKVHCTGDASARAAIDAVAVLRSEGYDRTRFQIAHGQFVDEEDWTRMRDLQIIAESSPFLWYPGVIPAAIGKVLPAGRARRMSPQRALTDLGVLVAAGSDWPVCPTPNPWHGIAGLVTRADPTREHPGTLWPEQALTVHEALRVFTVNGARAMGLEDVAGTLEVGKSADFVVIDRDPFAIEPADIADTRVLETWFEGTCVYRAQPSAF